MGKAESSSGLNARWTGLLLAFLIVLFLSGIGVAIQSFGRHGGEPSTFFDPKGVLTGPGTVLILILTALAALIVTVAATYYGQMVRPTYEAQKLSRFRKWVEEVVLKDRRFAEQACHIRFLENGAMELEAAVRCPINLSVWRVQTPRAEVSESPYRARDQAFDLHCDWQTDIPERVTPLLQDLRFTNALLFISGLVRENASEQLARFNVASEKARVILPNLLWAGDGSECLLAVVDSLVLVARSLEAQSVTAEETSKVESRSEIRKGVTLGLASALGCMLVAFVVAIVLVLKYFGLAGGMACFFLPLFLMAIFTFTRPSENDGQWTENNSRAKKIVYASPELIALQEKYVEGNFKA